MLRPEQVQPVLIQISLYCNHFLYYPQPRPLTDDTNETGNTQPVIWKKIWYITSCSHAKRSNLIQFWQSNDFSMLSLPNAYWNSDKGEKKGLCSTFISKQF